MRALVKHGKLEEKICQVVQASHAFQSWYLESTAFCESRTTSVDFQPARATVHSQLWFPSEEKKIIIKNPCWKGFWGAPGLVSNNYCIRYPWLTNRRCWLSCQPCAHKPESGDWTVWRCVLAKQSLIPEAKACLSLLDISFSLFISPACQECPKRQDRNLLDCSVTSPVLVVLPKCCQRAILY